MVAVAMACAAQTPPVAPQAPATQAQPPAQPQAPPSSIRISVDRVNVAVTVTDSKDRFVADLTKNDFTVYEDGKKVPIDFFTSVTQVPLRVGMLLDTSNSVRLQFKAEQEAAIDFIHTLLEDKTRHKAFLMTFDTTKDIVKDFTSDPNDLSEAVRKLKVGGGTALFDAIYQACQDKLAKEEQPGGVRRILLLITDGEDDASKHSIEQVIDMARRAEVTMYAISTVSYGSTSPGDKVLERLAEATGGIVVFPWKKPPSAEFATGYLSRTQIGDQNAVYEVGMGKYAGEMAANLALALAQINKELQMQYTIGYRPPNAANDGRFREIKVVARQKGVKIRARKGYYPN
jgi:Ca-activated chloride channel family protein